MRAVISPAALRVRLVSASTPPRTEAVPPRWRELAISVSEMRSEARAAAASSDGARQRTLPSSVRLAATWLGVGGAG